MKGCRHTFRIDEKKRWVTGPKNFSLAPPLLWYTQDWTLRNVWTINSRSERSHDGGRWDSLRVEQGLLQRRLQVTRLRQAADGRSIDSFVDRLFVCLLIDWLIDWLTDWLIYWLTDWSLSYHICTILYNCSWSEWHCLTPYSTEAIIVPRRMIRSWYTGCWWVGCYIWYSEEGTGRSHRRPRPILAVPNVTAHLSTASVPVTVLLSVALQF